MAQRKTRWSVVLLIAATVAPAATALEFRSGGQVVVAAEEVVDGDLYATGDTVRVLGTVTGDLVAAGREVRVAGRVGGDLIAAGQAVVLEGRVADDARLGGMALLLGEGAEVADHLVAAGYSLETGPRSTIAGSLLFSGYQALLNGTIGGGLTGSSHAMEIGGEIVGDVDLRIEDAPGGAHLFIRWLPGPVPIPEVAPGLKLSDLARIGGTLAYRAIQEAAIAPGAVIDGGTDWREATPAGPSAEEPEALDEQAAPTASERLAPHLRRAGSLLVVGLLLIGLAPRWLEARWRFLAGRPLAALGVGLLAYLVGPLAGLVMVMACVLLAALLAVAGLGGLSAATVVLGLLALALLALAYLGALLWVAPALAGLAAGRWLLARTSRAAAARQLPPILLGVGAYVLLRAVPFLGAAVGVLAMLFGMGALGKWLVTVGRD